MRFLVVFLVLLVLMFLAVLESLVWVWLGGVGSSEAMLGFDSEGGGGGWVVGGR